MSKKRGGGTPFERKKKNVQDTSPRVQAAVKGEYTYYTGKLCRRGHMSERYTKNAVCVDCAKVNQQKYIDVINKLINKDMREKKNKLK
jgi:hypothetical protein